jgi:hypothetical protein
VPAGAEEEKSCVTNQVTEDEGGMLKENPVMAKVPLSTP